ncbi:segregation/condensation protein A [Ammoniphilus oxalaticus]|uniref:Segregation and condensation protein A n=1 Tax=Ammoniphilus oxalaticus TaxID=66863 RepID=A0A419SN02_9BACL|nr:segregation/condensation protein A [Ammoniphilus oxalaticus]RKD25657.1 segregation/condensation protein A [Ammoniphilus oxalaticus]
MDYKVRLHVFEGPLDLLLHLIDQAEVDIYDIPISEITDQYMEYIDTMQQFQIDVASEFLVMAATLVEIKSNMLLPKKKQAPLEPMLDGEEDEADPRQALIERLLKYRQYKTMAEHLKEKEAKQSQLFSRPALDLSPYRPAEEELALTGVSLYDLARAFTQVLKRAHEGDGPIVAVHRDEVSITDRMIEIEQRLMAAGSLRFSTLFRTAAPNRAEIVTSFMAILEMMTKGQIRCEQSALFAEIVIRLNEN